jgi:hypothetical protein
MISLLFLLYSGRLCPLYVYNAVAPSPQRYLIITVFVRGK